MRPKLAHLASFAVILACCLLATSSSAQWSQFTQEELRTFTEQAVRTNGDEIKPPEISIVPFGGKGGRLVVYPGSFPSNLTSDSHFNRVLDAQFQVTLYRIYRNQPLMRRRWAPTLDKVEDQIRQMLAVISQPNLIDKQKDQSIDAIESNIESIYDAHFVNSADYDSLEGGWSMKATQAATYVVTLWTQPPGGSVKYIPALEWDLYVFAWQTNKQVPKPQWQTPVDNELRLVGEYYFYTDFGNARSRVVGPVNITKTGKPLVFTIDGLQQR